jgi:hypothetical protein
VCVVGFVGVSTAIPVLGYGHGAGDLTFLLFMLVVFLPPFEELPFFSVVFVESPDGLVHGFGLVVFDEFVGFCG